MATRGQPAGVWLAVLALAILARPACACDVPVFQYALEYWRADPYEAILFHRKGLDPQARDQTARLRNACAQANLLVREVDLDHEQAPQATGRPEAGQPLPWLVLRYPVRREERLIAWAGPLDATAVEALIDSPVRRQIVRHLLDRKAGVWVLLSSGDSHRDQAARRLLAGELARMERTLELPPGTPNRAPISFPIVLLNRSDPAEWALVRMLLGSEPDLAGRDDPMVFPIYGRGRVLYALIGGGINEWTISEAAEFLVGPCSCEVKSQNPGLDMLIAADWDSQVQITVADVFSSGSLADFSVRAEQAERMLAETPVLPAPVPAENDPSPATASGMMTMIFALAGAGLVLAVVLVVRIRKEASRA